MKSIRTDAYDPLYNVMGTERLCCNFEKRIEILKRGLTLQNFTMLIRAMRRLRLPPPRSWLEAAGTDLINRIVELLMVRHLSGFARNAAAFSN